MLGAERRALILEQARREGSVRVADLVSSLRVSDVTVRRDIDLLAQDGLLTKVHGGAMLAREVSGKFTAAETGEGRTQRPKRAPATEPSSPLPESTQLVVGVLVPKSPYYFKGVVDGVREALPDHGKLILAVSDYAAEREKDLVAGLLEAGATGLLLAPCSLNDDNPRDAAWLDGLGVPVVLAERRLHGPSGAHISSVRTAHESGAEAAVRHLAALGHQRVALLSRGDTPTSLAVRRGWQTALEVLGLPTDVPCISGSDVPGWPQWNAPQVADLAGRLRASGATALLCHSDEDALELLQNGLSSLLDVPGELSIVAYDDEFSQFAHPPLTAVSPPKHAVGTLALRTLLEILADEDAPARHIELEPRLIVRDSTGPRQDRSPSD